MNKENKRHLTNYHSHCDYCDGRAPMEDFVKSAIEHGFSSYGISSHSPLPDYIGHTAVLRADRVNDYISDIRCLQQKYRDQIEIYAGMEIDYIDDEYNPSIDYFQDLPLDYRIGSVHFLKVGDQKAMDADTRPESFLEQLREYYDNDIKRVVRDYFGAKMRMIEAGGFDFVGHTDKISSNASVFRPGITQEDWYMKMVSDYFHFVAERDVMLEINTKAFHVNGMLFPNREHLELIAELKIPVVVNSDAHYPHLVNSGRLETIELLLEAGYTSIRELSGGQWQDVGI